jgi:hypothetical protein
MERAEARSFRRLRFVGRYGSTSGGGLARRAGFSFRFLPFAR